MTTTQRSWIDILTNADSEALWTNLFNLISRHSSIRLLYPHGELSGQRRVDICSDLTQDIFLRLLEKNRWQYYLSNGYSDERVEQELYRIELPNYVSTLQRKRFPESFRLARRISDLVKTRPEFRLFSIPSYSDAPQNSSRRGRCKMVLRVYGLSSWPVDKSIESDEDLLERTKHISYRPRDVRRVGRSQGSQLIISNQELLWLIVEIFTAIDRPLTIRRLRTLVMSKLAIEDSRPVSLEAFRTGYSDDGSELPKLDLPDERPSPLELLLAKEATERIQQLAESLIGQMRDAVRNKPKRFYKLLAISWSCYFDPDSPAQTTIARRMKISDSLVSHYRGIFDRIVQPLNLNIDEYILLNGVLSKRIAALVAEFEERKPLGSGSASGQALPAGVRKAARAMPTAAIAQCIYSA